MSDVGGGEPPATGRTPFVGGNVLGGLPGMSEATQGIRDLNETLKELKATLRDISGNAYFMAFGLNTMLDNLTTKGTAAASALKEAATSIRAPGAAGGTPTAPQAPGGSGGSGWANAAVASAGAAVSAAGGGGGSTGYSSPPGGMDFVQSMGLGSSGKGFFQDILMMPLRYMRDTITANRQTALDTSRAMSMNAFATGTSSQAIMQHLGRMPGSILGQTSDMLNIFGPDTRQYGMMYGWGGQNAPRTAGLLAGTRQMQMMNPGATGSELISTLGGFSGNVQAQQASQMMTGGAFGMVKAGGGQKTLSEWAESVLRWLEGLRGGGDRGKPFDYGQLMAQYFPGSNIDAWFETNGVPQNMRDYWWTYALGKAKSVGSTQGEFSITPESSNVAWQRLNATTSLTRGQFGLAGAMSGAYANKEVANRWMNDMMGSFNMQTIPAAVSSGPLNFMQYMPDTMEQMLMSALERSGMFGSAMAGLVGYGGIGQAAGGIGSSMLNMFPGVGMARGIWSAGGNALQGDWGAAGSDLVGGVTAPFRGAWDVGNRAWDLLGDIGDYGPVGGTGLGGLHPDMKRKVGQMMQDNPRLTMTSGLRDTAMQRRLKERGLGRVSGKPSAHTKGLAADLGPRSEYNWIASNAGRYGLRSGKGQGEPWHVGIGDEASPNELFGLEGGTGTGGLFDVISGFIEMMQGAGGDSSISGMGKMVPGLLNLLRGAIVGNKEYDASKLEFRGQELYDRLYAVSKDIHTGGIMGSGSGWLGGSAGDAARRLYPGSGGRAVGGMGGGQTPPDVMEAFQSTDKMARGAAVVKSLHAAGFRGQELAEMAAIAWHESGWNRLSFLEKGGDMSYGLFALNRKPWLDKGLTPPFSKEDAFDPYTAATIARQMYLNVPPYNGPGGHNTYGPWTTRDKDISPGNQARAAAGLGDVDYMSSFDYMNSMPAERSTGGMTFNNSFVIQGGAGGTGIDMRRTITTIADHLETEMRQRAVRTG